MVWTTATWNVKIDCVITGPVKFGGYGVGSSSSNIDNWLVLYQFIT